MARKKKNKSYGLTFMKYDSYFARVKYAESFLSLSDKFFYTPFAFIFIAFSILARMGDFNASTTIIISIALLYTLYLCYEGLKIRNEGLIMLDNIEKENERSKKLKS